MHDFVCMSMRVCVCVCVSLQDILERQGFLGKMGNQEHQVLKAELVCLVSLGPEVFQ